MTSQTLASDSILQNLYWQNINNMRMTEDQRNLAQSLVATVAKIQDSFTQASAKVNKNGDLSAQGRASGLVAASKDSLDKLDALTKPTLAALDRQITDAARSLRKAADGPDGSAITELRAQEARAAFAQIDPLLRPMQYLQLCETGVDDESCRAVENASSFSTLLTPQTISQGRSIRGARQLPDQQRVLDVAGDLRALLQASVQAARRHMAVAPLIDPLQIASLGPGQLDALGFSDADADDADDADQDDQS